MYQEPEQHPKERAIAEYEVIRVVLRVPLSRGCRIPRTVAQKTGCGGSPTPDTKASCRHLPAPGNQLQYLAGGTLPFRPRLRGRHRWLRSHDPSTQQASERDPSTQTGRK